MNPPLGPAVMLRVGGSSENCVASEEKIIFLYAVLRPILANNMMKMTRTPVEIMPPVAEVYSGSPS
jgi:hypothetical protein